MQGYPDTLELQASLWKRCQFDGCHNEYGDYKNLAKPNINLIRKLYHSCLLQVSREKDTMGLMSKADAHSDNVARNVFDIATPADDAKLAHIMFTEINGPHVEFPNPYEIEELGVTIESTRETGQDVGYTLVEDLPADGQDEECRQAE